MLESASQRQNAIPPIVCKAERFTVANFLQLINALDSNVVTLVEETETRFAWSAKALLPIVVTVVGIVRLVMLRARGQSKAFDHCMNTKCRL